MTRAEAFYWRARAVLTPGLENSQCAYIDELRRALAAPTRWLDLGCGHEVLQPWLAQRVPPIDLSRHIAVGLDPDHSALTRHSSIRLRVEGRAERLPFADSSFELISANMVLEHVADPATLFAEVKRVLRPGGVFLFHTPNARGYTTALTRLVPARFRSRLVSRLQGRHEDDVYPTFYRANDEKTLTDLANRTGLRVKSVRFVQSSPQLVAVPPLLVGELMIIRLLSQPRFQGWRPCVIVALENPPR